MRVAGRQKGSKIKGVHHQKHPVGGQMLGRRNRLKVHERDVQTQDVADYLV